MLYLNKQYWCKWKNCVNIDCNNNFNKFKNNIIVLNHLYFNFYLIILNNIEPP